MRKATLALLLTATFAGLVVVVPRLTPPMTTTVPTPSATPPAAPVAGASAAAGASAPVAAEANAPSSTTTAEAPAAGEVASPSAGAAGAPSTQVEVVENADTETTLEKIIPRRSVARTEGLDKTQDPLHLGSSAAVVMETGTRKVLFQKNESAVLPMASITKLMTGVLVAEAKLPMDESITVTEEDVDNERHSRSRLKVGTTLTRSEALHLALMSSENRAAHALGRTFPGGLQAFVPAMNAKAKQLGMTQTTYVDPTGLSDRNRSTARDLATLVEHAARYPVLRQYSTDPQHQTALGNRNLLYNNSNRLVKNRAWDIDLQKTGYIVEAGHCVVMQTKVAGRDLVMVLLDAQSNGNRNADAERLRRWLGGAPAPAVAQADKHEPQRPGVRKVAQSKGESKAAAASARADRKTAGRAHPQTHKTSNKGEGRVRKSFAGQVERDEKVASGASGGKG